METNNKKIFITGGAGYVGAALVPKLLLSGYKVTVYDLLIFGKNVLKPHPNLSIISVTSFTSYGFLPVFIQ